MKKSHPLLMGIESVKPYKLTSSEALYDIRPPAMQIDQFLTVGGIMGMTAYPGVGKSWLALEVCRAVASGTDFLGRYRAMRGGVLFVGSDSSEADYARQWTRMTKQTPDAHEAFEPVKFLLQSEFMFEDRDEVRKLIRTHQTYEWGEVQSTADGPERESGFHVICFDTVSRLTRANQNDNTEMEEVFRNIRYIAEATNAAIILIHHNSKKSEFNDGSDWRGAMSQIGALDSWVHLAPARANKYLIGVQFKKFRGITPEDFAYHMNVSEEDTASLTATDEAATMQQRLKTDTTADTIHEYVRQHPWQRASEIGNALWPKFSEGIAPVEGGTTITYATKKKLNVAIQNRLNAGLNAGKYERKVNDEGKPVYRVKEAEPDKDGTAKRKSRRPRRKS